MEGEMEKVMLITRETHLRMQRGIATHLIRMEIFLVVEYANQLIIGKNTVQINLTINYRTLLK